LDLSFGEEPTGLAFADTVQDYRRDQEEVEVEGRTREEGGGRRRNTWLNPNMTVWL